MPDLLQRLLDKEMLSDLILRTVAALDAGDWQAYGNNFAADARFSLPDHTATSSGSGVGAQDFIAVISGVLGKFDTVQHYITNMVHNISGDRAEVDCYVIAEQFMGTQEDAESFTIGGRYQIRARRDAGEWRLLNWDFHPGWHRGDRALFERASRAAGQK